MKVVQVERGDILSYLYARQGRRMYTHSRKCRAAWVHALSLSRYPPSDTRFVCLISFILSSCILARLGNGSCWLSPSRPFLVILGERINKLHRSRGGERSLRCSRDVHFWPCPGSACCAAENAVLHLHSCSTVTRCSNTPGVCQQSQ